MSRKGKSQPEQRFLDWLHSTFPQRTKSDPKPDDEGYVSTFYLGDIPIGRGRGSTSGQASLRARKVAMATWDRKKSKLKEYLSAFQENWTEAPEWTVSEDEEEAPTTKKAFFLTSPFASFGKVPKPSADGPQQTKPAKSLEVPKPRGKALPKTEFAQVSKAPKTRVETPPKAEVLDALLAPVPVASEALLSRLVSLEAQVDKLTKALSKLQTAVKGEFQDKLLGYRSDLDRLNLAERARKPEAKEIRKGLRHLEEQIRILSSRVESGETAVASLSGLGGRINITEERLEIQQAELDLVMEEIQIVSNSIPERSTTELPVRLASEKNNPHPIEDDQKSLATSMKCVSMASSEFLSQRLTPCIQEWVSVRNESASVAFHCCVLACNFALIPSVGWAKAYQVAMGSSCNLTVIPVEAWWLSFRDLWRAGLEQAWDRASDDSSRLELVVLQSFNRTVPQYWVMPLMNIRDGFVDELPEANRWPTNLRLTATMAADDACLRVSPSLLHSLGAVRVESAAREESVLPHAVSWDASVSLDDWYSWRGDGAFFGRELKAPSAVGRGAAERREYRDLASAAVATGLSEIEAQSLAAKIRFEWPIRYGHDNGDK